MRSRWLDIGQVLFLRKKRTRLISSHLDRTNLVNKGFIIWLLGKSCLRDTAGSPERARRLYLAGSGSQSQLAIWFILPACGASHIIKHHLAYLCSQSQPKVQFILLAWGTCLTIIHINAWDSKHGIINHFKATCHPVI